MRRRGWTGLVHANNGTITKLDVIRLRTGAHGRSPVGANARADVTPLSSVLCMGLYFLGDRSARRMILPVAVSGSSATNSTMRGYSWAARRERT